MQEKKLSYNIRSALLLEIVTVVSGLILPRMIMYTFGSQVNGLVNSITQFLSMISFLEFGVGAVVQSALYKPLAQKDDVEISKIVRASDKYFGNIGKAFLAYLTVLIIVYPTISDHSFSWQYSALLIVAMSISTAAQYFFGVGDCILLTANQEGYIYNLFQGSALVLNTASCVFLIYKGFSIHFVKLTTSVIFFIRVLLVRVYVKKHYKINRKIIYSEEPIKQKWNGFSQHLANLILESTDMIVLTVFSALKSVSIYSAYYLVIKAIKQLIISFNNGYMPLLGELWATKNSTKLNETFQRLEWIVNTVVTFVFGCTGVLIVPFVRVYTSGVNDTNYEQPLFALVIAVAYMLYCFDLPYLIMIRAAGHYRQTQKYFMITAAINLASSVLAVRSFGLVGVAVGTLLAMLFQLCWMVWYTKNNLIDRKIAPVLKQFFTDAVILALAAALTCRIEMSGVSYLAWFVMALKVGSIWAAVAIGVNLLLYRENTLRYFKAIKSDSPKGRGI